jgi:ribonuclease HII
VHKTCIIAGVDEAGRGALAGPVVAAACILSMRVFRRRAPFPCWGVSPRRSSAETLIADSKLLSPQQREKAYMWITAHCVFGIGIVDHRVIDSRGILKANHCAMLGAIDELLLKTKVDQLLIDGSDDYVFPLPHTSVIQGDRVHPCIGAASILAKVTRDRLLTEIDTVYPEYGFASHKGYGSQHHISVLRKRGPCVLHRKTFIRGILELQALPLDFC